MKYAGIVLAMTLSFCLIFGTIDTLSDPSPYECRWDARGGWNDHLEEYKPGWVCTGGDGGYTAGAVLTTLLINAGAVGAYALCSQRDQERRELEYRQNRDIIRSSGI